MERVRSLEFARSDWKARRQRRPGNPGWRLRHTGCVLRAEAALCLTNEPARLSSGRWPAAPKGGCQRGGTPFGALLLTFGAYQKDGVARGRNPAQGCPWGQCRGSRTAVRKTLCPKLAGQAQTKAPRPKPGQLCYSAQNTLPVAAQLSAKPRPLGALI